MARTVDEVMTHDPRTISPDDTVHDAARVMRDEDVGAVLLEEQGKLAGILTDRDIVVRCVADDHGHWCTVCDHMTRQPLATVGPDADLDEVTALMRERRIGRVMVVEDGRLVGVVATADVARGERGRDPVGTGKMLFRISEPAYVSAA
jgi:CBS domain-containing protein